VDRGLPPAAGPAAGRRAGQTIKIVESFGEMAGRRGKERVTATLRYRGRCAWMMEGARIAGAYAREYEDGL